MSACRRVIGSTDDGKHLVVCGQPVPCPDHFPIPRTTVAEARFWPTGAHETRYLPVRNLAQISDPDWNLWASVRAEYPDVLIPSPKECREEFWS